MRPRAERPFEAAMATSARWVLGGGNTVVKVHARRPAGRGSGRRRPGPTCARRLRGGVAVAPGAARCRGGQRPRVTRQPAAGHERVRLRDAGPGVPGGGGMTRCYEGNKKKVSSLVVFTGSLNCIIGRPHHYERGQFVGKVHFREVDNPGGDNVGNAKGVSRALGTLVEREAIAMWSVQPSSFGRNVVIAGVERVAHLGIGKAVALIVMMVLMTTTTTWIGLFTIPSAALLQRPHALSQVQEAPDDGHLVLYKDTGCQGKYCKVAATPHGKLKYKDGGFKFSISSSFMVWSTAPKG
ncbi:hypothetical protein ON010_g1872 [Phytophthora cinnamomi]|nr:hypothetical protein ON010_g1872 [Phytophthora cinnamomi]